MMLLRAFVLFVCAVPLMAQQTVTNTAALNGGTNSYALAFRSAEHQSEVWLTVAPEGKPNHRVLAVSRCGERGFEPPQVQTSRELNHPDATYNGVPSFNPCNPNEAVFVSNRPRSGGGPISNDLYVARYDGTAWSVRYLNVNSDGWDDTPTLAPNGEVLYFSSDRRNPGSGSADIYICRRSGNGFTQPELLSAICSSNDHEASPFVYDDTLYYTSNRDGSQDIWSVPIGANGLPTGTPSKVQIAGINDNVSDEYHPMISPGGNYFMFASNRSGVGEEYRFRIYHVARSREPVTMNLSVTARTKIQDAKKLEYFGQLDSIYNVQTQVQITNLANNEQSSVSVGANGTQLVLFDPDRAKGPFADQQVVRLVAQATPHRAGYTASVDTLEINIATCSSTLEHTLYLDDTVTKSRTCDFSFRTFSVPFFISAYWCPTTKKYRSYTPCTSLFAEGLECAELTQPEHCETNEAYNYQFVPAKLIRTNRSDENCVNYAEFERRGEEWANEVDVNIERMRDEVRAALNESCIQASIRRGNLVSITYVGSTDDRALNTRCTYTGKALEEIKALAPDIEVDSRIEPFIATGKKFNSGGYGGNAGGNQLLSDLRSLYFAILFDNLCRETIPAYRELRESGRLHVRSRGEAIDKRDLPFEFKRAAGVEISVPGFAEQIANEKIQQSRTIRFCQPNQPCGSRP